jgi:DNA-binding NarL/FixJ family response regulator
VRVVIADARPLARAALRLAVDSRSGISVVADVGDAESCLQACRDAAAGLAVVAADLAPDGAGPLCARVRDELPDTRTLVVADGPAVDRVLELLEAGADGVTVADDGLDALLEAASVVADGHTYIPVHLLGTVLHSLIDRRRSDEEAQRRYRDLSARERETLALLGRGYDAAGIASHLVISPQTSRTHIQNVLRKLGVHTRVEAAAFAIDNGFCDLEGGAA